MKTNVEQVVELKGLDFQVWKEDVLNNVKKIIADFNLPKGYDLYCFKGSMEDILSDKEEMVNVISKKIDNIITVFQNKSIETGRECLTYKISLGDYQAKTMQPLEPLEPHFLQEFKFEVLNSQRGNYTATGLEKLTFLVANTEAIRDKFDMDLAVLESNPYRVNVIYNEMGEEFIYNYSIQRLIENNINDITTFVKDNIKEWDKQGLSYDFIFDTLVEELNVIIPALLSVEEDEAYDVDFPTFVIKYDEDVILKIAPVVSYQIKTN